MCIHSCGKACLELREVCDIVRNAPSHRMRPHCTFFFGCNWLKFRKIRTFRRNTSFQSSGSKSSKKQTPASCQYIAWLFDPKDGGDLFFWNVGSFPNAWFCNPEEYYSSLVSHLKHSWLCNTLFMLRTCDEVLTISRWNFDVLCVYFRAHACSAEYLTKHKDR